MRDACPAPPHVGLFDSGIGGLSVLRAVRARLPQATCTYLADTAFTPWGDRPADWVVARCTQLSGWLIAQGADLVLVACNTGTTQAIAALRSQWPHRVFVGVEPGVKPAVAASRNGRVAVMATAGTLRSRRLHQLVDRHAGGTQVLRLPCPGLAEAIERADPADPALQQQLDDIAATLRRADVDTVVLGCTHYPLVAEALSQRLGPGVALIDTAEAVARRVAALLPREGGAPCRGRPAPLRLRATGDGLALARAAARWLSPGETVTRLHLPAPPRP